VLLAGRLPRAGLGWLGVAGGLFVIYLGIESIRAARAVVGGDQADAADQSRAAADPARCVLWRAVATNLLNPHPYLFWATAGAPLLLQTSSDSGAGGAALFLAGFYALLVGSKLLVALIVSQSRGWLRGRAYQRVLVGSGALLAGLGLLLIGDGLSALIGS